jgi:uncharacterized protein YegL
MSPVNHEVVAIIDRSGSMRGKEDDTIGGINSTIEVLKNDKDENTNMKMSVKLFDHEEIMLFRSINLDEVRPLLRRQFVPRGQTALLDAIGNSLTFFMEKKLLDPTSYDYCTIYISTDGLENCSKNYNQEKIKTLIQTAESKYNIKIVYLGANQDAILEASKFGISGDQALSFNETRENYRSASRSVGNMVRRQRTGAHFGFSQDERNNATQSQ